MINLKKQLDKTAKRPELQGKTGFFRKASFGFRDVPTL